MSRDVSFVKIGDKGCWYELRDVPLEHGIEIEDIAREYDEIMQRKFPMIKIPDDELYFYGEDGASESKYRKEHMISKGYNLHNTSNILNEMTSFAATLAMRIKYNSYESDIKKEFLMDILKIIPKGYIFYYIM